MSNFTLLLGNCLVKQQYLFSIQPAKIVLRHQMADILMT